MKIDWITVSAQIVNFLVLVWLLKRFLYEPVMRAMEQREQRVARRLADAADSERQADITRQGFEEKAAAIDAQREQLLADARDEAEAHKRQMIDAARDDIAAIRANWRRQLGDEQQEFLLSLQRQSADAIQHIAGRALTELADADLEDRITLKFIDQLKMLDKETRRALADAVEPVRIRSAFELDSAARARLTRAVHEHIADGIEVEYERHADLVCGLELSRGGRRLGWSLATYLQELKDRIDDAFAAFEPTASEAA
jgi:F-type H+-transporting ATPase subunit b